MKVIVFGTGAIGSNLLHQLAMSTPDNSYAGVDFDVVEDRNLKTQLFLKPHIGFKKVDAVRIYLALKDDKLKFKAICKKILTNEDIASVLELIHVDKEDEDLLVVDSFDNIESRVLLHSYGFKNIIHIGFSPKMTTEITWGEKYVAPIAYEEGEDICENPQATSFINLSVSVSTMTILDFFTRKVKDSYIIYNSNIITKLN